MKKLTPKQRLLQLQTRHLLFFGAGVVLTCVVIWLGLIRAAAPALQQRMVTFYDRGTERSIVTTATTVRAALASADISIDSNDIVDPVVNTELNDTRADVIIYRSRPVVITDGSIRQVVMTTSQSPNSILSAAGMKSLDSKDKTKLLKGGSLENDGRAELVVTRAKREPAKVERVSFEPKANALTRSKGAHVYVDGDGVAHRETYYDLPMNIVIKACGPAGVYTIRSDGAKVDQDGYILVAAGLAAYPRCTVVDTSMGPGKVYDTGGFALRHPYGFDLATDWTNFDGI